MAIEQLSALRTWVDGQAFSARDYVYERNLIVNKVNETVLEFNSRVITVDAALDQINLTLATKVDEDLSNYNSLTISDASTSYFFVNYGGDFYKVALSDWSEFFTGTMENVMYTDTYDTDNTGVVDDSEKLGGQIPSYYAKQTDLDSTNTQVNTNLSNIATNATNIAQNALNISTVGSNLGIHSATQTNPHNVTAAQVGAYTQGQVDNLIQQVYQNIDWKEMVATIADLDLIENPEEGWTVSVAENDITYRFDGVGWVAIQAGTIPNATDTAAGLFYPALYEKLANIEIGATGDQTAYEIKTLYESNADTNVLTNDLKNKLIEVEYGATADQTASEIKVLYESNTDTNAFTDALKTKLEGVDAGATANPNASAVILDPIIGMSATNVQDGIYELNANKADVSLIGANVILYPTATVSDVTGYYKMVTDIEDVAYNTTPVDISTGTITSQAQLLASLITDSGLIDGNPGVINIPTIGNIAKVAGNSEQYAEFYFEIYHRTSAGVETLIGASTTTGGVNPEDTSYYQFNANALLNNGIFLTTDRLVIKYFANMLGNTGAVYNFQFGGANPVRTLLSLPYNVIPAGSSLEYATQADAEAGIENTKVMTPLRVAQALSYQLVGTAPETLNTLQELSAALQNNPDVITNLLNNQGTLSTLLTSDKDSLVGAINEVYNSGGGGGSTGAPNLDGGLANTVFDTATITIDGGAS